MKQLLGMLLVVAMATVAEASRDHYLIENHILDLAPESLKVKKVASKGNRTLIQASIEEAAQIVSAVHENQKACGGLIIVEEELAGAESVDAVFDIKGQPESLGIPRVMQSGKTVQRLYEELSKAQYMTAHKMITSYPNRNGKTQEGVQFAKDLAVKATEMRSKSVV